MLHYILLTISLLLIFGAVKVSKTVTKIRVLREQGRDITKKNKYYKLLANTFIKNLPS